MVVVGADGAVKSEITQPKKTKQRSSRIIIIIPLLVLLNQGGQRFQRNLMPFLSLSLVLMMEKERDIYENEFLEQIGF